MRGINLLPAEYRPKPKFQLKRLFPVLLASIILMAFLGVYITLNLSIYNTNQLMATKNSNIQLLEKQLENAQGEIEHLKSIETMVQTIEKVEKETQSHGEFITRLEEITPKGMEITTFNVNSAGFNIQGEVGELHKIAQLLNSIYLWEEYESVTINQINHSGDKYFFGVQGEKWRGEK